MESPTSNNEKMDGFLVYRRKRKHDASELCMTNTSCSVPSDSEGSKGNVDDHADMPAHAAGEHGGDDGGEMISCKACSHTFHLRCLSPPLESIPDGDWQCRNCSDNIDLLEPIANFKKPKKESNFSSSCFICSRGKKKLKLPEDEAVKSKSLKSSSTQEPNALVEVEKIEIGDQEGAAASDAGICGVIIKHTLNKINHDKLLMLRKNSEACNKSEALNKSIEEPHKLDEKAATVQQPNPVKTTAGQTRKEKYAKLRARQKAKMELKKKREREKMALKKKSEVPLSSSTAVMPKKSFHLQIVENNGSVALKDLHHTRKVRETGNSSSMGLSGQDKTTPNTSSHLKNGSASGFTSRPSSFPERVDTTTSRRPSGLLILKGKKDGWSEYELDALWVGIRRHGQGNWEAILADPLMALLKNRTPQDLSRRWEKETLEIFPSAVPLSIRNVPSTATDRSAPHALNRSGYSVTDTTAMLMQNTRVPLHMSGIKRFPFGVENQSLMLRSRYMPSLNAGISGSSHIQGSSSRVSQMVASAPPQRASSNTNMKPMTSQLLPQTLAQRTNVEPKLMMPMRMHALQTSSETVISTKRKSSSASAEPQPQHEPKLLLGGHFHLPKVVALNKSAGNTGSNPLQVEADKEETASSSEKTTSG